MVQTISLVKFCLSSMCFIILAISPSFCFVPSRISWLSNNGRSSSSDDIALPNYQISPFNSYRTSSMPLPLSRFMNVFNENQENDAMLPPPYAHLPVARDSDADDSESSMLLGFNRYAKRGGERLCGPRLIKKMATVCKNCLKSPDSSAITKRSGIKDMGQFAQHCCSTGCSNEDFLQFCC